MKYKAFISYRHCEPDSVAAKKIIKVVETYGVPKIIAEKHNINKHVGKLFRDEDELAAADNLSDVITEALDDSEYLIMICSPRYLESEWCMLEVQHWINRNGRKNIIAILLEGEPEDSFPRILTDYEENGKMIHAEPLAIDVRGSSQKEIVKNIDANKLRILSSLIGCNYDDLRRRQQEREKKNAIAAFATAFSVFAIITATVLISYNQVSKSNRELVQAYAELDEKNTEIEHQKDELADANTDLENKNTEIEEANRSLLSMNATALDKMADAKDADGNYIFAEVLDIAAYKTAVEAGADTSEYLKKISEHIDLYYEYLLIKVNSTEIGHGSLLRRSPGSMDLLGNEHYCIMVSDSEVYGYDVVEGAEICYKRINSDDRVVMLDGAKFAVLHYEARPQSIDYALTVTITDMLSGEEYLYSDSGAVTDAAFYDDTLIVLKQDYDSGSSCNVLLLDNTGDLKKSYEIKRHSMQIINGETILCDNARTINRSCYIYNFKTGEETEVDIKNYVRQPGISELSGNDYVISGADGYYYYNRNSFQYSHPIVTENEIIYNQVIPLDNAYAVNLRAYDFKNNTSRELFNENYTGNLRFTSNKSGSLYAYAANDMIEIVNTENGKNFRFNNFYGADVRKLILGENYVLLLFYEIDTSWLICFDPETFKVVDEGVFQERYDDAVSCGDAIHMFSYEKTAIDSYYCSDLASYKPVGVDVSGPLPYNDMYGDLTSSYISNNIVVVGDRGSDAAPEYYIINTLDGNVLGHYTPEEFGDILNVLYVDHDMDWIYSAPGVKNNFMTFNNSSKQNEYTWILPDFGEKIKSPESISDSVISFDGEPFMFFGTDIFYTKVQEDGSKIGVVYDAVSGKEKEKISFFDDKTDHFYIWENIRAEWQENKRSVRIYDGTELIETISHENAADVTASEHKPDIIFISSLDKITVYSLSEKRELMHFESDETSSSENDVVFEFGGQVFINTVRSVSSFYSGYTCEEANGKSYMMVANRYLVDTENWTVIKDFGARDNMHGITNFYYNEYLDLWGFVEYLGNGDHCNMVFRYPDTFEEAFTIKNCVAASPDGKYVYKINYRRAGRIMYQIPLLNDAEIVEKSTKILNAFGVTEDMLSSESVLG
ncbi:MAG: toll/interleukin-1 receptor domain-containing protein [Oscillospiraceae bacterium]|nr:toll/interleukin-1 receptor domain-containing protein [Oscillospiraceae bacterium]